MILFQSELSWSVLELLVPSVDSGCRAPLLKQETKGLAKARSLLLRCLNQFFSMEKKINYLKNEVFVCTFHRWGGLVFIMCHHDQFLSWMMIQNDNFPSWMMIRYFSSH